MKARYKVLLFLLLTSIFFAQCKKYEEDDVFIQWKKPEKRLIKYGPWVFDKLTVDGIDKSAEFRADSAYFERLEFIKSESGDPFASNLGVFHLNNFNEQAKFKLLDNNEIIQIDVIPNLPNGQNYNDYGPIFIDAPINWIILRLSKKGITLKTNYNSTEYILELKPE